MRVINSLKIEYTRNLGVRYERYHRVTTKEKEAKRKALDTERQLILHDQLFEYAHIVCRTSQSMTRALGDKSLFSRANRRKAQRAVFLRNLITPLR